MPKLVVRIDLGTGVRIGWGKIVLLEAIDREGSISAGARAVGMSYRRAWLLVEETNAQLRAPAVATNVGGKSGGGAGLTEAGRALIAAYRTIEAKARESCADELAELRRMLTEEAARDRA
jgi:molybdate transport system regulatory protein